MKNSISSKERLNKMYIKNDSLSIRIALHNKYSVNKYGWNNWVFDQYAFIDGMKILEIGCGTGVIWIGREERLPKDSQIILADYSELMLEKAAAHLSKNPVFTFEKMDIQNIPFDNDTFDAVIANHMLYHVPDINKGLGEVYRVLKKSGIFYSTTIGENSLCELEGIYHELEDRIAFSYSKNVSFTLENGLEILKSHFSVVEQRRYIDELHVTDIDDVIEYIKSYNDIPDEASSELYNLVKSKFSSDGKLHISKEQGMFICGN